MQRHAHTLTHTHSHIPTHRRSREADDPEERKFYKQIWKRASQQYLKVSSEALSRQFRQVEHKDLPPISTGEGDYINAMGPTRKSVMAKHVAAEAYYVNINSIGMSGSGALRRPAAYNNKRKENAMKKTMDHHSLGKYTQEEIMGVAQEIPNDRILRETCKLAFQLPGSRATKRNVYSGVFGI